MHNKKASRSGMSDNNDVRALIREIVKAELAAAGHTHDRASKLSDGRALYEIDLDREIDQIFSGLMNKFRIQLPGASLRKLIDQAGDILKKIEREQSGGGRRNHDYDTKDQTELVRRSIEALQAAGREITPENIARVMTKLARAGTKKT